MGCCQPVLGPIENYYTKYQTDERIEEAISGITGSSSGCCITPEEVDEKIEEAISGITVSGITEEQAEEMIKEAVSGKIDSSDVYTKQESDVLFDEKLDVTAYTPTDLTNYYTKDETSGATQIKTRFDILSSSIAQKQTRLVSGENIKTINNESILGDGNLDIQSLLDVPVYKGSALASVSINNQSGDGGGQNRVSGVTSLGAGWLVETKNRTEAAFGNYNLSNSYNPNVFDFSSGSTLFSVGNGHSENTGGYMRRHNAFEIRQNGDIYIADTNSEGEPYEYQMIKLQDVIKSLQNEIDNLRAMLQ